MAMQRNDWAAAAEHFVAAIVIDWPCSGERIVGRADFVAPGALPDHDRPLDVRHPPPGHRGPHHGERGDRDRRGAGGAVIAFSDVADGLIARHVEYWPTAYEPAGGPG